MKLESLAIALRRSNLAYLAAYNRRIRIEAAIGPRPRRTADFALPGGADLARLGFFVECLVEIFALAHKIEGSGEGVLLLMAGAPP